MKTIIAGSRTVTELAEVSKAVRESGFAVTEVVSGGARGVDALGEEWANQAGVPVKLFPADWKKYGRGAGPIRNSHMAEYSEALIAVWDGKSRGTKDMVAKAQKRGLRVFVYTVKQ
jgi:hypothetical protein